MKNLISRKKKGFTLVELLVVVAIIAILMLLAIPKFTSQTKGATVRTFEGNVRTLASQVVQEVAASGGNIGEFKDDGNIGEFLKTIKNKPNSATYDIASDKKSITCKLTGVLSKDYVLEVDGSGQITRKQPAVAAGATGPTVIDGVKLSF